MKFSSPPKYKDYNCLDFNQIENGIYLGLGLDIISSIFFILTCKHEREINEHDQFERFNELNNILLQNNQHMKPWANSYILLLEELIQFCFSLH